MDYGNQAADLIVDVITEKLLPPRAVGRGFSGSPYLGVFSRPGARPVITERDLLENIRKGEVRFSAPRGALITPLAELLVSEGRIKVVYER